LVRNRRGAHDTAVLCVYRGGEPPGGAAIPVVVRRRGPEVRGIAASGLMIPIPGRRDVITTPESPLPARSTNDPP
jgi:hypothetical protein